MPATITVDHSGGRPSPQEGALTVLGVRAGLLSEDVPDLDLALADLAGFEAARAQVMAVAAPTEGDGPCLLVGLGDDLGPETFRKVGAAVSKAARRHRSVVVDVLGAVDGPQLAAAAGALAEGLVLGDYRFDRYKATTDELTEALASATVVARGGRKSADAVARGVETATAMVLVRDLVNTPGGDLTPAAFAERAVEVASVAGLEIEVLGPDGIAEAGLGGLLGVSRGSAQEPRFLTISHVPDGAARGRIALVGKGVTFDSGGLSIKTSAGMEWMKTDMAGAATVLGAMSLVPTVAPRLAVSAYLPLTDNMLGPDATRVGDVLRARNGKTIEVLNTDAEGRLILADALSLAAESEPDAIVDLATLTGACMVALGERTAGVMGNHDVLRDRVLAAAEAEGEAMWPLPLPDHLRKSLDSEVADLRNIGTGAYGGALTAGLFLREFVDGRPWVHLDIAGPADTTSAWDENARGATGFGVRTLANLLAGWKKLPPV